MMLRKIYYLNKSREKKIEIEKNLVLIKKMIEKNICDMNGVTLTS